MNSTRVYRALTGWLMIVPGLLAAAVAGAEPASWEEVIAQSAGPADHVMAYGPHPDQFGELRLPPGSGPHRVVVMIHGGCWLPDFDLDHVRPLADAITALGFATWTIEYRRPVAGEDGWPDTFLDAAAGLDALRDLAETYSLDLEQITLLGHSAGGQLALWLAARSGLDVSHPLYAIQPLAVARVLALAAVTDLVDYAAEAEGCRAGARRVLGGTPEEQAARYRAVSPVENLPGPVRVELVHGDNDRIVPLRQSERFAEQANAAGGRVRLHRLPAPVGHFDVILPYGAGWALLQALLEER